MEIIANINVLRNGVLENEEIYKGIAYCGYADVVGGKMWFLSKSICNECDYPYETMYFHTKKELIESMRKYKVDKMFFDKMKSNYKN